MKPLSEGEAFFYFQAIIKAILSH